MIIKSELLEEEKNSLKEKIYSCSSNCRLFLEYTYYSFQI
jgi:hypothetical protein